jgi:uncharacterized protein (TIGR02466 family)
MNQDEIAERSEIMENLPIFSFAIHRFNESQHLKLAKKIVNDNKHLLDKISTTNGFTNFSAQNETKHLIYEDYKNQEDVDKLKKIILSNAIHCLKLYDYYSDIYEYEVTNLWINIFETESKISKHNHYGYLLSGSFYVDVPINSNNLSFENPLQIFLPVTQPFNKKYNNFNSSSWTINPQNGEMYFWLSQLHHWAEFNNFENHRISFSYDISTKKSIK